jgi:metal-dependent HD superfamily phosphatase/phosphodiesterase
MALSCYDTNTVSFINTEGVELFQKRFARNKFDIYIFIHTNIFCSSQVVKKKIHKCSVRYCAFLDSLQTH